MMTHIFESVTEAFLKKNNHYLSALIPAKAELVVAHEILEPLSFCIRLTRFRIPRHDRLSGGSPTNTLTTTAATD
jgi:hypothetical protein